MLLQAYVGVTTWWDGTKARFHDDEKGASAVEYALLVALIAVVIIGAITPLGKVLYNKFCDVKGKIDGSGGC